MLQGGCVRIAGNEHTKAKSENSESASFASIHLHNRGTFCARELAGRTICVAQSPSNQASPTNSAPQPSDRRETVRPVTLQVLTLRLNNGFQAVAQARDQKGFVHNRAALKEHTANLTAFREATKLKLKDSSREDPCVPESS